MLKKLNVNNILWLVYISLLIVLLPHTAWAFEQFEPSRSPIGKATSWAAAIAFEAAIAALTHKLAKHIETVSNRKKGWAKFSARYLNSYSLALVFSLGVSSMANLAHAVEFGGEMDIFTEWNIPFGVYAVAFGAVLPVVSLMFARVLSDVNESEAEENAEIVSLKSQIADLRKELREANKRTEEANREKEQANNRFNAIGDMVVKLFGESKRDRILAAHHFWNELPGASIALIAGTAPSYVSEVLKDA